MRLSNAPAESIKSFYEYLCDNGKADYIVLNCNYIKFKDEIVEKYNLLEPTERGTYDCKDIKIILLKSDKAIDDFQNESAGIREEECAALKYAE